MKLQELDDWYNKGGEILLDDLFRERGITWSSLGHNRKLEVYEAIIRESFVSKKYYEVPRYVEPVVPAKLIKKFQKYSRLWYRMMRDVPSHVSSANKADIFGARPLLWVSSNWDRRKRKKLIHWYNVETKVFRIKCSHYGKL